MASNTDRIFMAEQIKVRDCNLSKHSSSNTASTTTLLSRKVAPSSTCRCLLFNYYIFILSSPSFAASSPVEICFLVCVWCVWKETIAPLLLLLLVVVVVVCLVSIFRLFQRDNQCKNSQTTHLNAPLFLLS